MNRRFLVLAAAGAAAWALSVSLSAQHHGSAHRHPSAAKLKNPVAASPESLASGTKLYVRHCAECHGDTGRGDGAEGEGLDQRPSDFTDAQWEHGSTDGEIFVVIRDGAGPKSEMKAFGKKLTARQIWDVVNFVRAFSEPAAAK